MKAVQLAPAAVSVIQMRGLLASLKDSHEKLEEIQKGLNAYLETKRIAFPRFFFLSNDDVFWFCVLCSQACAAHCPALKYSDASGEQGVHIGPRE